MKVLNKKARKLLSAQGVEMVSCHGDVIAGPLRAAQEGIPVGTKIGERESRLYRSWYKQLLWYIKHPSSGRITVDMLKGA